VTLLWAAVTLVALLIPSGALAHAELDTITPANGSTVGVAPTEIVATFTEDLDPGKSSIVVLNAGGAQIASGGTVAADDKKKMTLALPALDPGTYQVRWTSTSAQDGDIDRGTTGFTYTSAPSPSPTPSAAASATPEPSAAAPSPTSGPTVAPSPSADTTPTSSSTSDLLIPIVVAVILIAGLGYWLLRGRSRTSGTP
jgi:methionine-rich copper-binding protein CopC